MGHESAASAPGCGASDCDDNGDEHEHIYGDLMATVAADGGHRYAVHDVGGH